MQDLRRQGVFLLVLFSIFYRSILNLKVFVDREIFKTPSLRNILKYIS